MNAQLQLIVNGMIGFVWSVYGAIVVLIVLGLIAVYAAFLKKYHLKFWAKEQKRWQLLIVLLVAMYVASVLLLTLALSWALGVMTFVTFWLAAFTCWRLVVRPVRIFGTTNAPSKGHKCISASKFPAPGTKVLFVLAPGMVFLMLGKSKGYVRVWRWGMGIGYIWHQYLAK